MIWFKVQSRMKITDIETLLKQERNRLVAEMKRVEGALNALGNSSSGINGTRKVAGKSRFSEATRARMAAAQRARWAKARAGKKTF
jgi:hypothetical protein